MKIVLDLDDLNGIIFDHMVQAGFYIRESEQGNLKWSLRFGKLEAVFSTEPKKLVKEKSTDGRS
jgi:hypothetical protein